MSIHIKKQHSVPFTPEQVFSVVIDVEHYDTFLPWCQSSEIISREEDRFVSDLTVGFGPFTETYRSNVKYIENKEVHVICHEKPLKHLETVWLFEPIDQISTLIKFEIHFKLASSLFHSMIKTVFTQSANQMLDAFEKRLYDLYGPELIR